MSSETVRTIDPKTPTMPHPATTTTAQRLANLPEITSSLIDLSSFITKKLNTLPSDLSFKGLEEYRALVCREVASADSRTPGVFEQAAKEEHDFKNAQKVQLQMLVDEVKDLIMKAMEALQMVVDAKPVGDERFTENKQRALLSTITNHHRSVRRERPWHPLDEHNAEQRNEWEKLDLGSRLDLLEVDDRLAQADLEDLQRQIKEMEREREDRLGMIRDLKEQWRMKVESEKDGREEGVGVEEQTLPVRVKEDKDEAEVDEEPWIA